MMAAVAGVSAYPLSRPPPGNRRAGVIGEHLDLTYGGTVKGFAGLTAAGKPLADQTWRQRGRRQSIVAFRSHALRPRSSSGSASARIAGRETAGRNWAKIAQMDLLSGLPTKTWAGAADCSTILSSDRLRRHKGESFICCTAFWPTRFDECERR